MQVQFHTQEPVTSYEALEKALLDRLDPSYRESFLAPAPPQELNESSHGLSTEKLQEVAETLFQAGKEGKKILIFGDYDCDGVTATAILWETLHSLGIEARPFLPHREKNGYGISVATLEEVWQEIQPDVVITVDNGIVAHEAFEWLRSKGVFTILTDHHQPKETLPQADMILHSTLLSGAGIAWYLSLTLSEEQALQELDLAVLGTLADQVPLLGANRSLAVHGLAALRSTTRPSLLALAQLAKLTLSEATENTVHYGLAPRINAAGRVSHAIEALRALLSRNTSRMQSLLQRIEQVNQERQTLTAAAYETLPEHLLTTDQEKIVIARGEYAEGIVGLLASKLLDQYNKPSIVITQLGETEKASCRSIPGVDITALLRMLPEKYFLSLGGHSAAAGFTLAPGVFQNFLREITALTAKHITDEMLSPRLEVLCKVEWNLLTPRFSETLARFAPFGTANEEPIFSLGEVQVIDAQTVGKTQDHLRLILQNPLTKQSLSTICFSYRRKGIDPEAIREVFVRIKKSSYRKNPVDIEIVAVR